MIWMYQTDTLAKNGAIRERVQDDNRRPERFHDLSTVSSEFVKNLCLFLKNSGDGINRIACFKLPGEGMIKQSCPGLVLVVHESSVE